VSLTEEINKQYNNRSNKTHLYQNSPYTLAVRQELKSNCRKLLKTCFTNLSEVTLLEIGAGNGTNAFMFESMGIKLSNISFNELLTERIKAIKENFPKNDIYEGDATKIEVPKKFDIIYQSTVFTSILNDTDRRNLADKMWSMLKPGGIILWYDFIYNNPQNPDVKKVSISEVKQLFGKASNSIINRITLAPPIGRKVGKFYKLFNIVLLRSHILAVFQKEIND